MPRETRPGCAQEPAGEAPSLVQHGGPPSNRPPSKTKLRIITSGLDTLYVAFFTELGGNVVEALTEHKDEAAVSESDGVPITLGAARFVVRPYGHKAYPYVVFNDDLQLYLAPLPRGDCPNVYAQLRSEFLWSKGYVDAIETTRELVRSICGCQALQREIVSRADLCVDFQGWAPKRKDFDRFLSRAIIRNCYNTGSRFSGFAFGKGDIRVRLYSKTIELAKSGKTWLKGVWAESSLYREDEHVWRLEAQLRREFLKQAAIDTPDHLRQRLGDLWAYFTTEWLSLRRPTRSDSRHSRWPVNRAWKELSSMSFRSRGYPIVRALSRKGQIEQLAAMAGGCLEGIAAASGCRSIRRALAVFQRIYRQRLLRKRSTFAEGLDRKEAKMKGLA